MKEEMLHASNLRASHIEQAIAPFFVWFHHRSYKPEGVSMRFPAKDCLVRVLAQTEQGALEVARYHYFLFGSDFRLAKLKNPELVRYTSGFAVKYQIQQQADRQPETELER